jgi:amidase
VGLVSRDGIVPISAAQDTAGPITRTVADAAVLLTAIAGPDPADPITENAAGEMADYSSFLDPEALAGARLGVWRGGSEAADRATVAVLDAALARLRAQGAEIVDPVRLADADKINGPEFMAFAHEFKHDINAYLAGLGGEHPDDLAGLIDFNSRNARTVLQPFGQELFEMAEETSGDLTIPVYAEMRATARRLAAGGLDSAFAENKLDAVIALTGHPAWLIDHILGDYHSWGTSSPAAVAGYPSITVPAGQVSGLPVGLSFVGPAWSEPRLIGLAHGFELA